MDPIYGNRRWSILVSAAIASIGLSGCDGLIAHAGEVKQDARGLGGTFALEEWPKWLGAMTSDGTGGACLNVAMKDVPGYEQMQCTGANQVCFVKGRTQGEARIPITDGITNGTSQLETGVRKPTERTGVETQTAEQWVTLCDLPPRIRPSAVGQCWGRPTARRDADRQACNRSSDYGDGIHPATQTRWTAGVDNPVNQEPFKLSTIPGLAKPSHWRIVACVRDHGGTPFETQCNWGPIKEIP